MAEEGMRGGEGGVGTHSGQVRHGLRFCCLNRPRVGRLRSRFQGEMAGWTPPRISAAMSADQKARVRPLRIWGLRFRAKNA